MVDASAHERVIARIAEFFNKTAIGIYGGYVAYKRPVYCVIEIVDKRFGKSVFCPSGRCDKTIGGAGAACGIIASPATCGKSKTQNAGSSNLVFQSFLRKTNLRR